MALERPAAQGVASSLTWADIDEATVKLATTLTPQSAGPYWTGDVYGIPTGGGFIAQALRFWWTKMGEDVNPNAKRITLVDSVSPGEGSVVIVDDIIDSGRTVLPYVQAGSRVFAAFRKCDEVLAYPDSSLCLHTANAVPVEGWVHFPWEHGYGAEDAVVRLLEFVGEDVNRDGLKDTPSRVLAAWRERCSGYGYDPKDVLRVQFQCDHDELILLKGIEFYSTCEHHLLPFSGTVDVGYIPSDNRVVGLSKLARLVDGFAKRLQIQERMTSQVADALQEVLKPIAVGVVCRAVHLCMACRGVRKPGAAAITSAMHGAFRTKPETRAEFMALVNGR